MTKLTSKFINATGNKLIIRAKSGKRGIHIAATLRQSGQPTQTGCRQSFHADAEVEAKSAYDALVADAVKNGWTHEAVKSSTKNSFTSIPSAGAPSATAPRLNKKTSAAA